MPGRKQRASRLLSRFRTGRSSGKADAQQAADAVEADPFRHDSAALAEEIGMAALALAKRANAGGLGALAYLLECAALEAGAQAVTRRWPSDAAKHEAPAFTKPPPRSPR